jgi:hypothetical protein
MADLWNTDDTDSTDKHRFLCIRLFLSDLAEKRRILIREDQRYLREKTFCKYFFTNLRIFVILIKHSSHIQPSAQNFFPADLAEELRIVIREHQRYLREILINARYYGYRLSFCFPLISQKSA